jgi:hypothetical protein
MVPGNTMNALRHPLLPVGLLLVVLGFGNWYTGKDKGSEYDELLSTGKLPSAAEPFEEFRELDARTSATLLRSLQRGSDESALVNAKLDFYKVVQSGGRIFVLLGLFCTAAGLVRSYRQHVADRTAAPRAPLRP